MTEYLTRYLWVYVYAIGAMLIICTGLLLAHDRYEEGFRNGTKVGYAQGQIEGERLGYLTRVRREGHWDHVLTNEELWFITLPMEEQLTEWNKARGFVSPAPIEKNGILIKGGHEYEGKEEVK